jgi:hypothetical protein
MVEGNSGIVMKSEGSMHVILNEVKDLTIGCTSS